jgi:hypothetical protein
LTGLVPHISLAFSTGSCSLENFRDIDFKICPCILFFLCLTISPSSPWPHCQRLCILWTSPIRLFTTTKSSEPIRFTILLISLSSSIPYPLGYPVLVSDFRWQIDSSNPICKLICSFCVSRLRKSPYNRLFAVYRIHFQQAQFLLWFPPLQFFSISQVYNIYIRSPVASCDCVNPLLVGILPHKGFTFAAPEHQFYNIVYIFDRRVLYCTSDRAASPKVLFPRPRANTV